MVAALATLALVEGFLYMPASKMGAPLVQVSFPLFLAHIRSKGAPHGGRFLLDALPF